jgi:hypothetical protein
MGFRRPLGDRCTGEVHAGVHGAEDLEDLGRVGLILRVVREPTQSVSRRVSHAGRQRVAGELDYHRSGTQGDGVGAHVVKPVANGSAAIGLAVNVRDAHRVERGAKEVL